MKIGGVAFGVALVAGATIASAAVMESQFPPRTVRDLIEICAPSKEDPMMTAAINYCHGFAQGAVIVEEAHEDHRDVRKLFCLPSPPPPSGGKSHSGCRGVANRHPAGRVRIIMPRPAKPDENAYCGGFGGCRPAPAW